jgi:hypothetical protein
MWLSMNPKLYVFKRDDLRDYSMRNHIHFAVVDLERSKDYPLNFVCVLPQQMSVMVKQSSAFAKIFGNDSLKIAKKLLTEALETEDDSEIKTEIEKRLKLLEPKPTIRVKCRVCGNLFEPKVFRRYYQKTCQECSKKMFPDQK